MLPLTIWMNMPSFHQGDLFKALAANKEIDLEVIFAKELTPDRLDLGWHAALTGFDYRFLDERNKRADAIKLAQDRAKRVHIVNGLWSERPFAAAIVTLAFCGSTFAIYSEAPDPNQPRSILKKSLRFGYGRAVAPRATGALSVSNLAADFFRSTGIPDRKIYPFGYFRSTPASPNDVSRSKKGERIEIIFAGQFILRKGVDLLLHAIAPLFQTHSELSLALIGGGEMLASIKEQAALLGISHRLVFEGVLPADDVPGRIAMADVLVLPSRWDGWGMIVNESLSVGTPVIVSDHCGAADLVRHGDNGYVFRSQDTADLQRCISMFLSEKNEWPRFRANASAAGRRISIGEVTPYLIACLRHMTGDSVQRPCPPWLRADIPSVANV